MSRVARLSPTLFTCQRGKEFRPARILKRLCSVSEKLSRYPQLEASPTNISCCLKEVLIRLRISSILKQPLLRMISAQACLLREIFPQVWLRKLLIKYRTSTLFDRAMRPLTLFLHQAVSSMLSRM